MPLALASLVRKMNHLSSFFASEASKKYHNAFLSCTMHFLLKNKYDKHSTV
jgi:hypothetical protein